MVIGNVEKATEIIILIINAKEEKKTYETLFDRKNVHFSNIFCTHFYEAIKSCESLDRLKSKKKLFSSTCIV